MQRYTKNSISAANNNQSKNDVNIDSAKRDKKFSSFEKLIFFLDIGKKCDYAKIEDKIKSVGGTIRLFLTDDVTHFVTDKAIELQNSNLVNGSSPRTSLNFSSPKTPRTPELTDLKSNKILNSRTRSRVDEMIHRARLETTVSQTSLLDVALLKNIRVWDFDFANLYLNKLIKKIKLYKTNIKKVNVNLKEPYVKVEDIANNYRPHYKILKSKWPFVNLAQCNELNDSKTSNKNLSDEGKIKKKIIFKETDNKIDNFGYCEICKCEYENLRAHLKTEQHNSVASDPQNYESLDKLISEKLNVRKFLNEHFEKTDLKTTNKKSPSKMTKLQYHDYYSRSSNESEKGATNVQANRVTRQAQMQLDAINACKRRKNGTFKKGSKGSNKISNNHIKAENHYNYVSEIRNKSEKDKSSYSSTKDNSSLYYKVIKTQSDINGLGNKTNDNVDAKPAIIVKFRKIRQSELSILNGEAENFMFPKCKNELENKKENSESNSAPKKSNKRKNSSTPSSSSSDEKIDDKLNKNIAYETIKHNPYAIVDSSYHNKEKENKANEEYIKNLNKYNYSFERVPSTEPWYNVFRRQDLGKEHTYEYFGGTGYKKLPYEMGHIPITQSSPLGKNCILCKNKDNTIESVKSNNITEEHVKKHDDIRIKLESDLLTPSKTENNEKLINRTLNTKDQQIIDVQDEHNIQKINQSSGASSPQQQTIQQSIVNKPFKKYYLMNLDMPRKSPREHASTLAMLSCLVKKSNSCQNSINNDSKEPTPEPLINTNSRSVSTPSIDNDQDSKSDCKEIQPIQSKEVPQNNEEDEKKCKYSKKRSKSFYNERIQKLTAISLEKEIDYFLQKSFSDCLDYNNPLENKFSNSIIDMDIDIDIRVNDDDDDNNHKNHFEKRDITLGDLLDRSMKGDLSYNRPLYLIDDFKINQKKRPINRTGWPHKKKLMTRRQKGCITGFHHHKGVLVKKSSPWSFFNNNIHSNNDNNLSRNESLNGSTENLTNSLHEQQKQILQNNIDRKEDANVPAPSLKNNAEITSSELPNTNELSDEAEKQEDEKHHELQQRNTLIHETKSRISHNSKTIEKSIPNITPPSPRVLRKPRGRWYRER